MEENLTLAELNLFLKSIRKDENDARVFQASLVGVDLGNYSENSIEEKRREIERRAKERTLGYHEVERQELADYGITFEEL